MVGLRGIVLALEIIAAYGSEDGSQELTQDAVVIEVGHVVQCLQDLRFKRTGLYRIVEIALRVEASEEEFEQLAGNAGMGGQRLFNIGLAEGKTGLPQIFGIGTQDGDFAPVELGGQHQPVEVVALGRTAQHMTERVLENAADALNIQFFGTLEDQAKVMQPYRWPVRSLDFIRTLFNDSDAHVFEHGQRCREGDGGRVTQHLEPEAAGRCFERHIEAHRQAAGVAQRFHQFDVAHGGACFVIFAIAGREGVEVAGMEQIAALLAATLSQRFEQLVFPATGGLNQASLDAGDIIVGHVPGFGMDQDQDTGQRGFGYLNIELARCALKGVEQHVLHALTECRVVIFPGGVDQAGIEATEGVMADEQARPLPLSQAENAHGHGIELVRGDLEQFIARVLLQDNRQGAATMAVGAKLGTVEHIPDLLAKNRNGFRAGAVRGGCKQAEKAMFTDDFAVLVHFLDANVIEVTRAMNGRSGIGFGQDQQARFDGHLFDFRGQGRKGYGTLFPCLAQNAGARAGHDAQHAVAVAGLFADLIDQGVFPVAKHGEIACRQPLEEGDVLFDLGHFDRWWRGLQRGDQIREVLAHAWPIGDGSMDVGQYAGQALLQGFQVGRVCATVHLDMNDGFQGAGCLVVNLHDCLQITVTVPTHPHQRVNDQVHRQTLTVDFHGDGIDEEGHVLADDFDDRVR